MAEWSGHWWLLLLGVAAILAAWFYTGGTRPYGYLGWGLSEVAVFVFFGLVATVGTTYVQTSHLPWWLWVAGSGIGLISISLLMVNNIRDIRTDALVGKRTLAVRMGDRRARWAYAAFVVLGIAAGVVALAASSVAGWWVAIPVLALASLPGLWGMLSGASGRKLLSTLRATGLLALAYGVVFAIILGVGAHSAPAAL